ncbi:ABC transporter substrate binding protein [Desulfococcaceae bacterium HSG7]|nr:ABC transporter substrate binding protein [Desulfococcaceae bacterium HSG9]MDM8555074.1 ABC transporter substrate binding protein [Desulfococcaceae bacterium HSG7]
MKKVIRLTLFFCGLLIVSILWSCDSTKQADEKNTAGKKIMLLHSYHAEYPWVADITKGVKQGLSDSGVEIGKNAALDIFYMDTKRQTSENYKIKIGKEAINRIREQKPEIILAADDNAQKHVVSKMKDEPFPFIFIGVNADPKKYGYLNSVDTPGHNVTGFIERERFEQTVALLRKLKSGISRIAIICDNGPTGVPIISRIKTSAGKLGLTVTDSLRTGSFDKWQTFVKQIQDNADALVIIVYHTLKRMDGSHVPADEVLNWTIKHSKLPDIGFWSWAVEGGILCSEAISGFQHGYEAAITALKVINGANVGEFPVGRPQKGETCINRARAEMLGITIPSDLMSAATVYDKIGSAK